MKEDEKREALETVELIKQVVTQTREDMHTYRADVICYVWGIFSIVGFIGNRFLIPKSWLKGVWWTGLIIIGYTATYLVIRSHRKVQSQKAGRYMVKGFLVFWLPLLALGYVLTAFCIFHPDFSPRFIPVMMMLVVSTGFLMLGFMFYKEILVVGSLGFVGTVVSAVFFLNIADVILGILFGVGLILTGLVFKSRWVSRYPFTSG